MTKHIVFIRLNNNTGGYLLHGTINLINKIRFKIWQSGKTIMSYLL